MNSKEYREFLEAYKSVYEQQIGVPLKDSSDRSAREQLQKMIPKGEKVYIPKSSLQKAHYEPEGELIEDIEERRKQLAQKRREQIAGFRERISGRVKANIKKRKEREEHSREQIVASRESDIENRKKRREQDAENRRSRRQSSAENKRNREEREQLKSEIKSELAKEAVGDPISPSSVYKLSDPVVQKNIKSAMTPSGPSSMKPKVQSKPQSQANRFVKRMVGSTMLSPL